MAQSTLTLAHLQTLTNEKWELALSRHHRIRSCRPVVSAMRSRVDMSQYAPDTTGKICISYNLAAMALIPESEVLEIVAHEVAHVVQYALCGPSNYHNWYWQGICSSLGGNPNRTYAPGADPSTAVVPELLPKKMARYYKWHVNGLAVWKTRAEHNRDTGRLVAMEGKSPEDAASVLMECGEYALRERLSAARPASVPLIAAP